jgi:hypothetical protein
MKVNPGKLYKPSMPQPKTQENVRQRLLDISCSNLLKEQKSKREKAKLRAKRKKGRR